MGSLGEAKERLKEKLRLDVRAPDIWAAERLAQEYADACMDAVLRVASVHSFPAEDHWYCRCGAKVFNEFAWRAHVLDVAERSPSGTGGR